jgi:ribonuclease BN (tRNA processing enzyme)
MNQISSINHQFQFILAIFFKRNHRDAGKFALALRAKRLVITHFSARYGDGGVDAVTGLAKKTTADLLAEAQSAATQAVNVIEAKDFLVVSIPPTKSNKK